MHSNFFLRVGCLKGVENRYGYENTEGDMYGKGCVYYGRRFGI